MTKTITTIFTAALFVTAASAQEENIYRTTVGDYEVILLSEGQSMNDPSILIGASDEMLARYIPTGKYPSAVNAWLIRNGQDNILVDTGFGRNLFDNLAVVGVKSEEIDLVLLTHMHGDHIGGMLTGGEPSFPNAFVVVSEKEYDYWTSDEAMNALPESKRGNFTAAREVFAKYEGRVTRINPNWIGNVGDDGIHPVAAYGHTPGHTGFMIESRGERLLIWGDLTHVTPVQMPHPEIAVSYDVNPETAVLSRLEIMEFVADNDIRVAGMHIPRPGTGRLVKAETGGYTFIPAAE